MPGSYVSKVLATPKSEIVAIDIYDTSSRRHRIHARNWRTNKLLAEFNTVFDGHARMAINSLGSVLFAGNWRDGENGGVAAYETGSGQVLWHRRDISETQSLHFSHTKEAVWCSTESGPVQSIHAQTGETLFAWETIRNAFDSPFGERWLAERETDYVLVGEPSIAIQRLTAGLLQAVFTPETVCLTESRGPVRCLESKTGREQWRYSPENGHVIQLSYQQDNLLYGVLFLSEDGKDSKLVRFEPDSGKHEVLFCQAERNPYAWSIGPGVLITRSGDVVSLEAGDVIGQITLSMGG
jgi:outer membrane protein assembly factor BamB